MFHGTQNKTEMKGTIEETLINFRLVQKQRIQKVYTYCTSRGAITNQTYVLPQLGAVASHTIPRGIFVW